MNFRQLEYVITIYREGTLTKAAEKLFISQPALTQQLQKLEKEIGTQLFDRTTTPLTPTYAGKYHGKDSLRKPAGFKLVGRH